MSLEELRKQIDEADRQIIKLIAERVRIAREIGGEKKKQGKQIEDIAREEVVLANVKELARSENVSQEDIENIYRRIISLSKNAEGVAVAFQGERGAYSEEAAFNFFGPSIQVKPCESLDDVFKMVEQGMVQFGIVPIENSLEGSISRTYDLLLDSTLRVCGEVELRVSHCLIAAPGVGLEKINKVYYHPQALGQCQAFLRHLKCEIIPTY
ncbi:MAG: chorismate mutase, partial [Chloroflexi bacterium]|nr:chorismate mutase [Chloroflexota bacterium]